MSFNVDAFFSFVKAASVKFSIILGVLKPQTLYTYANVKNLF